MVSCHSLDVGGIFRGKDEKGLESVKSGGRRLLRCQHGFRVRKDAPGVGIS